jgi:hypothetical protein
MVGFGITDAIGVADQQRVIGSAVRVVSQGFADGR